MSTLAFKFQASTDHLPSNRKLLGKCVSTLSPGESIGLYSPRQSLRVTELNSLQHPSHSIEQNSGLGRPTDETVLRGPTLSLWALDHESIQQEQSHQLLSISVQQPGERNRIGQLSGISAPLDPPPIRFEDLEDNPPINDHEENDCLICLAECRASAGVGLKRKQCTHCNRIFHKECIEDWLKHKHTCPNCRSIVDGLSPTSSPRPTSVDLATGAQTSRPMQPWFRDGLIMAPVAITLVASIVFLAFFFKYLPKQ
ncbi:uncharacterized protein PGTG_03206 [Puccinia graminis f. sp. tritici CRL 75-36-700-3]|uniref:RING-type domain-containing protein n=1 Tax=Puccinia graminis f. sp. tritici (strain CRL 75-36-700-3 / race SCCL) TaxID=418459 RepID=E3JYX5_PUCGT|nr:uncharacterized protein PGTG_03206 [Puccinia graminis f. sp. tritici CRL 75-36-700-3]EFP77250.1 hypothetical protein PGTG_03206 [Puccinia graminis f. sp. tritici CRL 75-36-700-3]